jgi:hypothetical protein
MKNIGRLLFNVGVKTYKTSLIFDFGFLYIHVNIYLESTVQEMYSPHSSTLFVTVDSCKCFFTKSNIPPLNLPALALLVAGKNKI